MLLKIEGLDVGYGQIRICHDVSLEIDSGELVCLLGRNGAGKTTLLRGVIGSAPHRLGNILFDGRDISGLEDFERAHLGIGYVPQGRLMFAKVSVADNLRSGTAIGRGTFGPISENVFEYFPILRERMDQKAGTLSGGEQQMLAIGRALAGKPRLLLLDEPSEGVQPTIVQSIRDLLLRIRLEQNLAMLLVEQNLKFATEVAQRGYVMDKGQIVASGSIESLIGEDVVQQHLTFQGGSIEQSATEP